ncbi:MAG: hypothetical protein COW85_14265 [Ignavibacteria bacterium CG22_combo_CG10-13_8_21_14_all_37_15]|nr:MAG: hypothetical protein COW85_14265 [Ignavibacteria bacterium CG22_combo_CG10-13_8_21_14_all_37_15]
MKKYLLTLLFILSSQGLCQGHGELKIPDIPFPKEIADTMSGDCHLVFMVDLKGEIESCKISSLTQLKKGKRGKAVYKVIYSVRSPELNTEMGVSLEKRLQTWLKLLCSKTKFIMACDADLVNSEKAGYFLMGHTVTFGKLWKKNSNQNNYMRPK